MSGNNEPFVGEWYTMTGNSRCCLEIINLLSGNSGRCREIMNLLSGNSVSFELWPGVRAGRIQGRAAGLADRGGAPDVGWEWGWGGGPERESETFRRVANVDAIGTCWQICYLFVGKKWSI
jgi:hypothetical protein